MLYKILLVSTIYQHESARGMRMSPPSVGFSQGSVLWDSTFLSGSVTVNGDNDLQSFITESCAEQEIACYC